MGTRTGGTRRIYETPAWRALRPAVLARDGHTCQIRGPKCTVKATDVDHIVPLADGGAPYDPTNTRAACRWCNGWLAAKRTQRVRLAGKNRRTW